ncbi:cAMP-binding domain of CRP or a regulatory subunit of cAMP-dependent protein kinases [Hathewaya proteolytica DSM 3090]|uniref:cAMP-binding domain of CRP or a regulatory subunit of cAMP-dependent protein kinases n=1 Tax=Hathewaya proteolytica DSM 3090 TaxID=1121331 RepID=A0A1M6SZM2_9CLOT|nr:Crp/Fnr family transcriptional regulator [Hathewaya proteolytica]SHK49998.1 cAMP-binding domain of CRP or a regulatory subunit of cAMP-dependent protein kinases [Hathewaya proteolytica DSM 3090]
MIIINDYLSTIEKLPLFQGIKEEDLISLLQCLNPKIQTFGKNEPIVSFGENIDKFGIILEGEASVLKETSEGNRVIIAIVKEGDLFGEMLVFSSRKKWPVTVRVQNSCKVLFLKNSDLISRCNKMCTWHNTFLENFIKIISDKALMLNKKVQYLSIKSIKGKIAAYLLDQQQKTNIYTINIPLKRNELAEFLNVSRPSLSREMCELRDEGIIDFHLSTFRIKDPEALLKWIL